ncbi:MAG: 3-hydroxyacyl-ACP dehydratase FabZ, partial [Chloroflexi bacterium]|nr:3-hydroxyacyl-ACP dehydratase FabZ [Chloroflexota bacterium]
RPPFLLVDRILELEPGVRAVGLKQFMPDEFYFKGHFPGNPIVPGVLMIEAMAQVGCVAILTMPEHRGKLVYFAAIDNVRFRRPTTPGDTARLEVSLTKMRGHIGKGAAKATVDGEPVVEAELTFAIVDQPAQAAKT